METDCLPFPSSSGAPVGSWGHGSACAPGAHPGAPSLEDPSTSASSKPHPITALRSSRLYFGFALLRTALQNYPCRSILVLSWPVETSEPPSSLPFVTRFSNTLILQECHPWGDKEQKPDKSWCKTLGKPHHLSVLELRISKQLFKSNLSRRSIYCPAQQQLLIKTLLSKEKPVNTGRSNYRITWFNRKSHSHPNHFKSG